MAPTNRFLGTSSSSRCPRSEMWFTRCPSRPRCAGVSRRLASRGSSKNGSLHCRRLRPNRRLSLRYCHKTLSNNELHKKRLTQQRRSNNVNLTALTYATRAGRVSPAARFLPTVTKVFGALTTNAGKASLGVLPVSIGNRNLLSRCKTTDPIQRPSKHTVPHTP